MRKKCHRLILMLNNICNEEEEEDKKTQKTQNKQTKQNEETRRRNNRGKVNINQQYVMLILMTHCDVNIIVRILS